MQVLSPEPGDWVVDATFGNGGHGRALAAHVGKDGCVIGIDRDPDVISRAGEFRGTFPCTLHLLHGDFRDIETLLLEREMQSVDAVLFDFGVSSMMMDQPARGFSFRHEGPLDMRMDTAQSLTAADIVNTWPIEDLERVLREYGEERFARRIARAIGERRAVRPLVTTTELRDLVHAAIPRRFHPTNIDAATRTFQGIRIAVNDELNAIEAGLQGAFRCLKPSGRLAAISFHSLEDRIVKRAFQRFCGQCICPPGLPVCGCGAVTLADRITRKPITPSDGEQRDNPRSRSARLRAVRRRP